MTHLKQTCFILIFFSLSFFSHAESVKDDILNDLIIMSGLKSQLQDLPSTVVTMIDHDLPGLSTEKLAQAQTLFGQVFNSDLILSDVLIEIKKTLSETEAKEVIAWYESNTGNRISMAEENAASPRAMIKFPKLIPELTANKELMSTVNKLLDETNLIKQTMGVQETVMLATMVGMSQASNPDQPLDIEKFKSIVDNQLARSESLIEGMITAQLAFAYMDIDKLAMDEYIYFLKGSSMKKFNDSQIEGSQIALNKALDRLLSSEQP
jgi:hypothetical protein